MIVCILSLGVGVSAIATKGFTTAIAFNQTLAIISEKPINKPQEEQEENAPIEQAYVRDVLGGIYA